MFSTHIAGVCVFVENTHKCEPTETRHLGVVTKWHSAELLGSSPLSSIISKRIVLEYIEHFAPVFFLQVMQFRQIRSSSFCRYVTCAAMIIGLSFLDSQNATRRVVVGIYFKNWKRLLFLFFFLF